MLQILRVLLRDCEVGISHNPINGFKAAAKGPIGVLALVILAGIAFAILR